VLVLAILLALALDLHFRRGVAIAATVAVTPVAAWYLVAWASARHAMLASQASETGYLTFLLRGQPIVVMLREAHVIRDNLNDYASLLAGYLSGWRLAGVVACVMLSALAVIGFALLRRRHRGLVFVLVGYVVVLLAWPVYQDRFLLPLLPLLGLASGYALHVIADRWGTFGGGRVRTALMAAVAFGGVAVFARQQRIRRDAEAASRERRQPAVYTPTFWLPGNAWFVETVSQWALQSTKPNDRIAVVSPAGLWLYTGRQTVPMEIVEPRGAPSVFDVPGRYLASMLVEDSVTVVVVESPGGSTAREVSAIRAACPNALTLIQRFAGIEAFRASPRDACVAALRERLRA